MSALPSNTEQFLGGLAAGTQNLALASQNQRAKMDYRLAQQQMGLERERMAQQGQQFQQGLQAEAANYQKLNESRERLAAQEMAQQQSQFGQTMDFNREQANLERMVSVKMKQLDMDLARNEQEIAAMANDDPRIVEARRRRLQLKSDGYRLQELISGGQMAMQFAQGLKGERLNEITTRLTAYSDGVGQRAETARTAFANGLQFAITKNAMNESFFEGADRAIEAYETEAALGNTDITLLKRSRTGQVILGLVDEASKYMGGTGDPDLARKRATDFARNGGAMAVQVVQDAISLNEGAFGLDGPEREGAAAAAGALVTAAAVMAGLDPRVRGAGNTGQLKQDIATNIKKLRDFGMGDEQIAALFDGLEGMSENRGELLNTFTAGAQDANQFNMLNQSLEGVGRIQDMIESVLIDENLMKTAGGKLADLSKFDVNGVVRKAQLAYGMGESPEMAALAQDLQAMGLSQQEIQALSARLIESDPSLQYLRPEEFAQMLEGLKRQQSEATLGLETVQENIDQLQPQVMAEGRLRGLEDADRRLAELAGLFGG
jgi:hypothetical protein